MSRSPGNGIQKIYSEVHGTYDLINRLMTFGLDVLWRNKAVKAAIQGGGKRFLDVCCGTGDMTLTLRRKAGEGALVVGTDFSAPMVSHAVAKSGNSPIRYSLSDSGSLPFTDGAFDAVTISFATRNINLSAEQLVLYFKEFRRVLKPDGRFVNLETSRPKLRIVRTLLYFYVRNIVKPLGFIISRSKNGYAYLARTIPSFYGRDELEVLLRSAGFSRVDCSESFFGIVALHTCTK